jgi:4'-phosphopantetheinyl transferase EntD
LENFENGSQLHNPAKLSDELARLFPAGVVCAELTESADASLLRPQELQFIAHCAAKRIRDFTAGRACAHRALQELGIVDFALLAGKQREPLWPASICGSITHTHGYAAAAVARQGDVRAVGIDCEVVESVGEDLWRQICTRTERERLAGLPVAERISLGALIFAAKEAFYKCQYPITRAWVGFEDVVIETLDWPVTAGTFRILPVNPLPFDTAAVARLVCRFQLRGALVLAAVTAAGAGATAGD